MRALALPPRFLAIALSFGIAMLGAVVAKPALANHVDSAAAVEPTGSTPDAWGWVVNRRPTVSHTPGTLDSANSLGNPNRIKRLERGWYQVAFKGIDNGGPQGAFVTALTTLPRWCEVGEVARHFPEANDATVEVQCYTRTGSLVDTMFSLNYLAAAEGGGNPTLGYLWANQPTANEYTPDPNYSYSSTGSAGNNIVYRFSTGQYAAGYAGLSIEGGNAQVASWSGHGRCKVNHMRAGSDTAEYIYVDCRTAAGDLVDAAFDVVFAVEVGLTGVATRKAAYVHADQPTIASYQPANQFNNQSKVLNTVTRSGVGTYTVTLRGMPKGGSAQVTAAGMTRRACNLTGIRLTSLPQKVGVHCFKPNGDPVDSGFFLTYTR